MLVERGILRHDQLARVVAERFGLDFVDLAVYDLDMGAVNLISADAAKRYQAVPVGFTDDGALLLAMANPTNVLTIDDVGMMTGRRVRPAAASVEDLNLLLARLARMDESIEDIVDEDEEDARRRTLHVDEADSDAPIIKLVHSIVAQAVQQGASDIHVNPEEGDTPRAVPRRRRARAGRHRQAQDGDGRRLAHQDHGRPRHLREARAAGRALRADRRRAARGHPRRDAPARLRRGRRDAHPRQRASSSTSLESLGMQDEPSWSASPTRSTGPTAPCS